MTHRFFVAMIALGCASAGEGGAAPDGATIGADAAGSHDAARDASMVPDAAMPDAATPPADPSQPGPYAVGVRTIMMTDPSRNRTFAVDLWYPAAPGGSS